VDRDVRLAHLASAAGVALLRLPRPVVRALGGRRPAVADGLDPEAWLLARLSERTAAPIDLDDPPAVRRRFDARAQPMAGPPPRPVAVEERTLPGPAGLLPARLYAPAGAAVPAPLLVFFHGGGWVQGSLTSHDGACRMLAALAGVRVLSVAYRLAPEHPFPAAADDALAAYRHAVEHARALGADRARIAVGGDSAGGNLAAVTALAARDAGVPAPAFQLLLYPALDLTMAQPSVATFAEGFFLTRASMDIYAGAYVPDPAQRTDPRASPLFAADLTGLPPAYIATAGTDPLRDEGEAYAARLRSAGVRVELDRHPLLHGFVNMTATRSGRRGVERVAAALRRGLAGPRSGA
jgi:acetyl esterase